MLPSIRLQPSRRPTSRQYMHRGEQEVLLALVESIDPVIMVEIGVNIGLTAQAVLANVRTIERYQGIDVDAAYQFEIPAQRIERPAEPGRLVKDDPRFQLLLRGGKMPKYCDVVFIDGDHGHNAVMEDSLWAAEIVKPGGMIIWHDYGNPTVQVTEVLDALADEGRKLHHLANTWLVFERR